MGNIIRPHKSLWGFRSIHEEPSTESTARLRWKAVAKPVEGSDFCPPPMWGWGACSLPTSCSPPKTLLRKGLLSLEFSSRLNQGCLCQTFPQHPEPVLPRCKEVPLGHGVHSKTNRAERLDGWGSCAGRLWFPETSLWLLGKRLSPPWLP